MGIPPSLTVRGSVAKAATLLLISLSVPRRGMRDTLPNLASCCHRDARTLEVSEGHRAPPCWGERRHRAEGGLGTSLWVLSHPGTSPPPGGPLFHSGHLSSTPGTSPSWDLPSTPRTSPSRGPVLHPEDLSSIQRTSPLPRGLLLHLRDISYTLGISPLLQGYLLHLRELFFTQGPLLHPGMTPAPRGISPPPRDLSSTP